MLKPSKAPVSWLLGVFLCSLILLPFGRAAAEGIVVMVNDDPITTFDLAQRQRFLAVTGGGMNDAMKARFETEMKARLQSPETNAAWRELVQKERPQSQAEAQALQKKFVQQIQQSVVAHVQQGVLSDKTSGKRKEALDQLIDEKLMLQAARDAKVLISDKEVDEVMTHMAESGSRKLTLKEFLAQFEAQGIKPSTLQSRIRAQRSWGAVIKQTYGSRLIPPVTSTVQQGGDQQTVMDVQVVKLAVPPKADQKYVAKRLVEAENLRKQFKNCAGLSGLLKSIEGASVKSFTKAKLSDFRGEVQAALQKGQAGQMTPPMISGAAVESHAICAKTVPVASGKSEKKDDAQDKMQEMFQLYSKRHLKDLKDHARLEYPKGG